MKIASATGTTSVTNRPCDRWLTHSELPVLTIKSSWMIWLACLATSCVKKTLLVFSSSASHVLRDRLDAHTLLAQVQNVLTTRLLMPVVGTTGSPNLRQISMEAIGKYYLHKTLLSLIRMTHLRRLKHPNHHPGKRLRISLTQGKDQRATSTKRLLIPQSSHRRCQRGISHQRRAQSDTRQIVHESEDPKSHTTPLPNLSHHLPFDHFIQQEIRST